MTCSTTKVGRSWSSPYRILVYLLLGDLFDYKREDCGQHQIVELLVTKMDSSFCLLTLHSQTWLKEMAAHHIPTYGTNSTSLVVSLQIQCLLSIAGRYLNSSNDIHSLSLLPGLHLLPLSIRIQLLILLAVDVCKLEGTLVTADIKSMDDEVWQILYRERVQFFKPIFEEKFFKADHLIESWKKAYFTVIFALNQFVSEE